MTIPTATTTTIDISHANSSSSSSVAAILPAVDDGCHIGHSITHTAHRRQLLEELGGVLSLEHGQEPNVIHHRTIISGLHPRYHSGHHRRRHLGHLTLLWWRPWHQRHLGHQWHLGHLGHLLLHDGLVLERRGFFVLVLEVVLNFLFENVVGIKVVGVNGRAAERACAASLFEFPFDALLAGDLAAAPYLVRLVHELLANLALVLLLLGVYVLCLLLLLLLEILVLTLHGHLDFGGLYLGNPENGLDFLV